MQLQFTKHYTRDEARALLPQIREWLQTLQSDMGLLRDWDARAGPRLAGGEDLGGEPVNTWVKTLAEVKRILGRFHRFEIQIKDIERGLIDFPAFIGGKEVFLCWEKDEEDIEYWHELNTGYSGRERLD